MGGTVMVGSLPPEFHPGALLTQWRFEPLQIAPIVAAGVLYWRGLRRIRNVQPPFPSSRPVAFYGGLAAIVVALASPVDAYSDVSLSVHMLQHLLLMFAAAPLLALGTPVTLALRASSPDTRRRVILPVLHSRAVRVLSHPVFAWTAFAAAQYATHFSAFYNAALDNWVIHAVEHGVYLGAGILFWWPIVGLDPAPRRLAHPGRLLYLVLAMPLEAFLGVAIMSASHPLYVHYASLPAPWGGAAALSDQGDAGSIMWVSGEVVALVAVLCVAAAWFRHDEARQRRIEAELDRAVESS